MLWSWLMPARSANALAPALIMAFGIHAGCVCKRNAGRDFLGKVSSPVDVKLIEKKISMPRYVPYGKPEGGLIATETDYVFELDSKSDLDIPVRCFPPKKVDFSAAKQLDRFAYRCDEIDAWHGVWKSRATGELLEFELKALGKWAPAIGADGWLDANSLPILSDAAPDILLSRPPYADILFREIQKDGGDTALTKALAQTAMMPATGFKLDAPGNKKPVYMDDWLSARGRLSGPEQTAADAGLKKALETSNAGLAALVRVASVLRPSEGSSFYDRYADRLYEIEADIIAKKAFAGYPDDFSRARDALLHDLIGARPGLAGRIGCLRAEAPWPVSSEALSALAISKLSCPAIENHLRALKTEQWCSVNLACDPNGNLMCTPDELKKQADEFVRLPYDPWKRKLNEYKALMHAGFELNLIPAPMALRMARPRYSIEMPASPDCDQAKPGEGCRYPRLLARAIDILCAVPPEQRTVQVDSCEFTIDDARKSLKDVRRKPAAKAP